MATDSITINVSDNTEQINLTVTPSDSPTTFDPDEGSPYYVGAELDVKRISNGVTVTATDKHGTTSATVYDGEKGDRGETGQDGQDGHSPVVTASKSGTVTTVSVDGEPIATINDGEKGDTGDTGATGATGADGFSPTASVNKSGDTATISITDKNGTTTASVTDGVDGQNGQDGVDGYSPSASVSKVGAVATITITDKDGTTTAEVYDGSGSVSDVTVDGTSVVTAGVAEIDLTGKADVSSLATVATSGSYNDLSNKPTIPTVPTNVSAFTNDAGYITGYTETDPVFTASAAHGISSSDISSWNGKSDFSGSYNDLTDKPTIPTVNNGQLTIQRNGTTVDTFTANASSNVTVNISASKVIKVTASSVSSLPLTISNAAITTNMEVIHAVLSLQSAQRSVWNWNTDTAGQVTISGTINGTTDITLYLADI